MAARRSSATRSPATSDLALSGASIRRLDAPPSTPRVPVFTAVGYGLTRPIADNKKAKGRAANRRSAFVILEHAPPPPPAPPNGNPDDSARPK
jgi:hypothetical protein